MGLGGLAVADVAGDPLPADQWARFGGFVVVVESDAPAPETPAVVDPAVPDPQTVSPPARNASREDWAEFLALAGFVTEGRGRDELIDMWDAHQDADALGEDFDTYAAAQGAPDEE